MKKQEFTSYKSQIKALTKKWWFIKTTFFVLFSFTLLNLSAQNFEIDKIISMERAMHAKKIVQNKSFENRFIDVNYYRLELTVEPDTNYINGSLVSYYTATGDSLLTITFDISDSLQVDSVRHRSSLTTYLHQDNKVVITLNDTLFQNDLDSISIYYRGVPQSNGLGTFVQDSYNGQDSIIWTLSQPYGASEWWPCQNNLADKADSVEILITTNFGQAVATNGVLLNIDTIGSFHQFHYKSKYPIASYLVAIAVTNYNIYREKYALGTDSLAIEHFLYPTQTLTESNNAMLPFLQMFDSLFGTYPFIDEKYGHASFTFGGGMEHQTMSFMGNYGGELVAHELAHQWFGNKITCGSWTELWLNEGFASYITALTYDFNVVHDSIYFQNILSIWKNDLFQYPNESVFRADTTDFRGLFGPNTYLKGAYLLHMLRWKTGDNAFFSGLKNYVEDTTYAYGFVDTDDLKGHLERSSGMNLTEFFKDWYYGKGFPDYTTLWTKEVDELSITIQQQTSDPSVYFFDIPIPYQIVGPNIDTTIILEPRFPGQTFRIPFTASIDSIIFDPDQWILAKNSFITSIDEIENKNSFKLYPNPSSDFLNIDTDLIDFTVNIYDIKGSLIDSRDNSKRIDIQELKPSIYWLEIRSDKTQERVPFVKE